MKTEFYLGVAEPDAASLENVLISSALLNAAARRGTEAIYCGSCRGCLAEDVSVDGLGATFGSDSRALLVDCHHCGATNVLTSFTSSEVVEAA